MIEPELSEHLSPLGYTYSLLIFVVPLLMFYFWLKRNNQYRIEHRAYFWAIFGVFCFGCLLDIIFGYSFFYFPNTHAVIGIRVPSLSFETWKFVPNYLPIEEFGFYLLGAGYMLSMYLWGVLYWFKRYNHTDHQAKCFQMDHIFDFNRLALVSCILTVIAGIVVKKFGSYPEGFPGYFTFLVLMAFLPCMIAFNITKNLINWRAFSFMSINLLLISIGYEATLGVPYGWWKYHPQQMLGLFITGWSDLPIEAILLWIAAGFGTVIFYEALRMYFYLDKPIKNAFFGKKGGSDPMAAYVSNPGFSSLPDYIDDGIGLPVPRGPYVNTKAIMVNFYLDVDINKIHNVVDRYLNRQMPKGFAYLPFVPKVQLTYAKLAGYANTDDLTIMGQLPEDDLVIWIPLIAVKYFFGVPVPQKIAMFPYRLYVNSAYGLSSGREVYGFQKTIGEFTEPKSFQDPQFLVKTLGFKTFNPETIGTMLPLFELEKMTSNTQSRSFESIDDCFRSSLDLILGKNGENIICEGLKDLAQFFVKISKPTGSSVSIKQFRDVSNPTKACYQEIIEAPTQILSLNDGGICKSTYSLKIHNLASNPIAQELGIQLNENGQQTDLTGIWVDMKFVMGNGRIVS